LKIKIKDLNPNPFRNIERYPIDEDKVEALRQSIESTEFWDNILVCKRGEKYHIAYGHHRLEALKRAEIEEINAPVKKISDDNLIRIMANENMATWKTSPAVLNETVLAVKTYLDTELAKYETWEELCSDNLIRTNLGIDSGHAFSKLKDKGVGRDTILKFLGKGWKKWMIQESLAMIKDDIEGTVDRVAIEKFPTLEQAKVFKGSVKKYNIPKEKQGELADKIIKDDKAAKRAIGEAVQIEALKSYGLNKKDTIPDISEAAFKFSVRLDGAYADLVKLWKEKDHIPSIHKSHIADVIEHMHNTVKGEHNGQIE